MSSRATNCLRIASRQLALATKAPVRSLGAVSKPRQYPSTTASRAAAATSTASKPTTSSTTTTTTTATRPPPAATKPAASTTNGTTTTSTASKAASPAARDPIPAVSGVPLPDAPAATDEKDQTINWSSSYHGLGTSTFGPEVATVLQAPLDADDIEVKPDGIIYLPEIKYRRVLNSAFGPGGWGLAPRGDLVVQDRLVSRDYALIVHGRSVSPSS